MQIRIIGAVKAYASHLKMSSLELKLTRILEEELGRLDVSVTHNKCKWATAKLETCHIQCKGNEDSIGYNGKAISGPWY